MAAKNNAEGRILLTVLVPVYNEERTITELLRKVTNLDIDKYEVIIVNDHSNDKTKDLIENFDLKEKTCWFFS